MYNVISPNGFPMTCEPFATKQAAMDAIPLLCERYEHQGYYSVTPSSKIPVNELPDYLDIVEV